MTSKINKKFIVRGFLFGLFVLGLSTAAMVVVVSGFFASPPNGPAPQSDTITAPVGELPTAPVGMEEWAKYQAEEIKLVGSGFFLSLSNGELIAVTTAHSLTLGNADRPLEHITFGIAGDSGFLVEMDTFFGDPGKPRLGRDMTVDYVLLAVEDNIDSAHFLSPDLRDEPEEGERLVLYSGLGDGDGQPQMFYGTVHTVNKYGFWVLMDDDFHPGRMSGSPFVSSHTGKVVGMAISAAHNDHGLMIGAHPIGSLVAKAESAVEFLLLSEFRR
jgi:hypothetical protein